jgi:AmiR/NasT family two-component response regulator
LRVLIANEKTHVRLVASVVASLGHDVIARQVDARDVGVVARTERPDVAFVGLAGSSADTLELIEKLSREAACAVIVLLHGSNPEFVKEATKRGVFACVTDGDPQDCQGLIEIALRRFAEYRDLKRAFARRAITERAKGILMERHGIDEARAFALLRESARRRNRKLIDVATAVVDGHPLLSKQSAFTTARLGSEAGVAEQSLGRIDRFDPELDDRSARGLGVAGDEAATGR